MFTGIIETLGTVRRIARQGESLSISIGIGQFAGRAREGDSIAVDGVCLTAAEIERDGVRMDVGEETFRRTTLRNLSAGAAVNIETSLTMSKPLGGHFVSGHVDGVGRIARVIPERTQRIVKIQFPQELDPFIVGKGSVAVDGISLTVGEMSGNLFSVYVIPHTWENTTLGRKGIGDEVNIEVDMLARYVWKAVGGAGGKGKDERLTEMLKGL